MAYKVKVRFHDTEEEIDLIEEIQRNDYVVNYYYHDSDGNYLSNHLPPYGKYPAQSIIKNMGAKLGNKMVLVSQKEED